MLRAISSKTALALSLALTVVAATTGTSAAVPIGFVSFDKDSPVTGENSFSIANLTGATFGCAIDFPVCTDVTILGSLEIVDSLGGHITTPLAAPVGPSFDIQFTYGIDISSATFYGAISPTAFTLADGSMFPASPFIVSATILPGDPDHEIGILDASPASVPEPSSVLLLLAGSLSVAVARYRSLN
jgi:hypothetical protein